MNRISLALAMVLTVLISFSQNLTELQLFRGSDTPNGSGNTDYFGFEIELSGEVLAVSAPRNDGGRGAVYVFELNAMTNEWEEVAKLTASDAATDKEFGTSVAIEGDVIVVGNGSLNYFDQGAYIFEKPLAGWTTMTETIKLNTPAPVNNPTTSAFGFSVDISGDEILVGAPYEDANGLVAAGRIYIYEKTGASWTTAFIQAELTTTNVVGGDLIGLTAEFGDNFIVTSALTGSNAGTLHVFERPVSGTWASVTTEDIILFGSDRSTSDSFGGNVATDGDRIVTLGFIDGSFDQQMNAYTFDREGTLWSSQSSQNENDLRTFPSYFVYQGFTSGNFFNDIEIQSDLTLLGSGASKGANPDNSLPVGFVFIVDNNTGNSIDIDGIDYQPDGGFFGSDIEIEGSQLFIASTGETRGGVVRYFDRSDDEEVTQTLCTGESILFGTQTITAPGVYNESFISSNGLDSLVELTVEGPLEPGITSGSAVYQTFNSSGLEITTDPNDQVSTHFIINDIEEGALFLNDETTAIQEGDYITIAEGSAGLKIKPTGTIDGSFEIQASIGTVTTEDLTITEEEAVPSVFTLVYDGFVNNEDLSVIDTEPTASTSAMDGEPGEYDIILSGGTDDTYDLVLVDGTLTITAILSILQENDIIAYPNPTVGPLSIETDLSLIRSIRILDLEGRELMNQRVLQVDISSLENGTYILEIEDDSGKIIYHRILKR